MRPHHWAQDKTQPSSLEFKGGHSLAPPTTPASPAHLDPSAPVLLDYSFPEQSLHFHTSALYFDVSSPGNPSRTFKCSLGPLHYVSIVLELLVSHSEHML